MTTPPAVEMPPGDPTLQRLASLAGCTYTAIWQAGARNTIDVYRDPEGRLRVRRTSALRYLERRRRKAATK